jgi:hypothetical protein
MFTEEEIQKAIGERILEVEELFGIDAAMWYKVGFMECVKFIIDMNKLFTESEPSQFPKYNLKYPVTGGIN